LTELNTVAFTIDKPRTAGKPHRTRTRIHGLVGPFNTAISRRALTLSTSRSPTTRKAIAKH
jgi:hypothetical protein